MPDIVCFLIEPTEEAVASLRRFTYGGQSISYPSRPCPQNASGHDATSGPLGTVRFPLGERGFAGSGAEYWPRDDPHWPAACSACGYAFQDDDQWQYNQERLYLRPETGERFTLREAPPGAMYRCLWYERDEGRPHWVGPDGLSLAVKLPGGHDWNIDGPANNNDTGWQRTGVPPRITVTPSIGVNKVGGGYAYHGWLRDGVLVDA